MGVDGSKVPPVGCDLVHLSQQRSFGIDWDFWGKFSTVPISHYMVLLLSLCGTYYSQRTVFILMSVSWETPHMTARAKSEWSKQWTKMVSGTGLPTG